MRLLYFPRKYNVTDIVRVNTMRLTQHFAAKYGYSEGMLVIMNFKADDVGVYKCSVRHETLLGIINQKDVTSYIVASSGEF